MDDKEGSAVTAVVKWFNPHKRYGFVHIPERNQDAFMHASVLAEDGDWPREDDTIECTLDEDGRGLKVLRVLKMSRAEGLPRTHGAVRWFDQRKGYGFIVTEQDQDIFVHRSALGQLAEEVMQPGRFVTFRAREGKKGLAAADVELDDSPPAEVADRIRARLDAEAAGAPASEQPPPEPEPAAEAPAPDDQPASDEADEGDQPTPEAEASPEAEAPAPDDQPAPDEADEGDQPTPEAEATPAPEAPVPDDQPAPDEADEGDQPKEA